LRLNTGHRLTIYNSKPQIRFLNDQNVYVKDLWEGKTDAAFVGSDKLFAMSMGTGCPSINGTTPPCLPPGSTIKSFRVLNARPGLKTDDGRDYPFQVSSILYPNEGIAALPHIDYRVSAAVARALLDINAASPPNYTDAQGSVKSLSPRPYYNFQPPPSYISSRDLFEAVGTSYINETTKRMGCYRVSGGVAYAAISCPPGYYKLSEEDVRTGCDLRNISCVRSPGTTQPQTCMCSPCRRADEVELRHQLGGGKASKLCSKMAECSIVPQLQPVQVQLVDNRARAAGLDITYKVHTAVSQDGVAGRDGTNTAYGFSFTTAEVRWAGGGAGGQGLFFISPPPYSRALPLPRSLLPLPSPCPRSPPLSLFLSLSLSLSFSLYLLVALSIEATECAGAGYGSWAGCDYDAKILWGSRSLWARRHTLEDADDRIRRRRRRRRRTGWGGRRWGCCLSRSLCLACR
jgi:hypothetical protein